MLVQLRAREHAVLTGVALTGAREWSGVVSTAVHMRAYSDAEIERYVERGEPFENEQRARRHDGQYRWFLIRYRPLRDDRGQVVRWYATATDIDERKSAEERICGDSSQAKRTWVLLTEAAEGGWGIAVTAFGREEFAALAAAKK